jgi:predicted small integral membrane protein
MLLRLSKILLTSASALFLFFVVFNNTTDYYSNFHFVQHVLSMDSTFAGNAGMWRAMPSPIVHHLFYLGIILWETACCVLIGLGTVRLWQNRNAPPAAWQKAKGLAALGLTISLFQWYFAFVTIGGEWFLMWQSKIWNGQDAAFRMFTMMGLSLIYLTMKNDDLEGS